MNKKSKNYVAGAFVLAAGALFSKFLGMFFKIPLTNMLGDYGMGLYGLAYPLYSTFLMISTAGLPVAVSKMVAESVSLGKYKQAYRVFYIAFAALAILGGFFSVVMFAGANGFIKLFNWNADAYYSIVAISFAPFFVCLVSVVRGFFQGMQRMSFTSISQVLEQIGRVFIGVALASYLNSTRGVQWGAAGATFGAVAGAIIAFIFLYISFAIYRAKHTAELSAPSAADDVKPAKELLKSLMLIAIPVAAGSVVTTLMDLINSVTISGSLISAGFTTDEATALYGQLTSKAQTLINVPLVIGGSLSASLVPSMSESFVNHDRKKAKAKASMAVRISFLIAIPSAIGLSLLSEPIIKLLFSKSPDGYEILTYLAYCVVFAIGMTTLQGILQGAGKYYAPLKNMLIGGIVKYILNVVLVKMPSLNIYGAVISTIAATFVICLLNFIDVKKYVGYTAIGMPILKTVLSAFIMALACKFSYMVFLDYMSFKLAVIGSIGVSIVVYGACIIGTGAFSLDDLRSVRS